MITNIHHLSNYNSEKLINYIPNVKHRLIVLLMLDCGLRVSETITIKFNQFDFKKKQLTIKSLKKRDTTQKRTIPLSNRLYQALADYIYIQKDKPSAEKLSNWLPAYDGEFSLQARLYWPEPESLDPLYVLPKVKISK